MNAGAKNILVAIAAVVVSIGLLMALKGKGPVPDNSGENNGNDVGFTTAGSLARAARILLEAESAQEVAAPMAITKDVTPITQGASSGKCCHIGPDKWNETWESGQVEGEWRKGHPTAPYPGFARYTLTAPYPGDYEVWVRVFWVDDCGNSLFIAFNDDETLRPVESSTHGRWIWCPLRNTENRPARVRLNEGDNVLTICNREDNVYIDQILIRDANADWPDPTGIERATPETKQ